MMISPQCVTNNYKSDFVYDVDICSVVNNYDTYALLERSLLSTECSSKISIRSIDNTCGIVSDVVSAINWFIMSSKAKYVLVCHQDVVFTLKDIDSLLDRLLELDRMDENWAVCGNAGRNNRLQERGHISDPYGMNQFNGPLPSLCVGLDENLLIYNKRNPIVLSTHVKGFHHYGIESCYVANQLGYTAYVVDFHVVHASKGNFDSKYSELGTEWHELRNRTKSHWVYCSTYLNPKILGLPVVLNRLLWRLIIRIIPVELWRNR
jgi:hypothetical protein